MAKTVKGDCHITNSNNYMHAITTIDTLEGLSGMEWGKIEYWNRPA